MFRSIKLPVFSKHDTLNPEIDNCINEVSDDVKSDERYKTTALHFKLAKMHF